MTLLDEMVCLAYAIMNSERSNLFLNDNIPEIIIRIAKSVFLFFFSIAKAPMQMELRVQNWPAVTHLTHLAIKKNLICFYKKSNLCLRKNLFANTFNISLIINKCLIFLFKSLLYHLHYINILYTFKQSLICE